MDIQIERIYIYLSLMHRGSIFEVGLNIGAWRWDGVA
jgi:hypothetical protein